MGRIVVAADADWVRNAVTLTFSRTGIELFHVSRGQDVRACVVDLDPDVVILDMQIGSMGGLAVAVELELEAGAGRAPWVPVVLLLDRAADRFLADRLEIDSAILKPFDPVELRRCVEEVAPTLAVPLGSALGGQVCEYDNEGGGINMASGSRIFCPFEIGYFPLDEFEMVGDTRVHLVDPAHRATDGIRVRLDGKLRIETTEFVKGPETPVFIEGPEAVAAEAMRADDFGDSTPETLVDAFESAMPDDEGDR